MPLLSALTSFVPEGKGGELFNRARRTFFSKILAKIRVGRLDLTFPDHTVVIFGDAAARPHASLQLRSWHTIDRILMKGDIGFAEAYADGECRTNDLAALFDLIIANETAISESLSGSIPVKLANRLRHLLNKNTKRGSRANISFHYDLGNDFYRAWLDPTMTYSAALFDSSKTDLTSAQIAKYRHICTALNVRPGDSILEIGCGWGGFAEIASREFGANVHGITLSKEQFGYAQKRNTDAGLAERVSVSLIDYRDIGGEYDHVVSIEMFEAVGQVYWKTFFDCLCSLLKPGGKVFLQIITIDDRRFESYAAQPDFIQRFIFPGGMLPSPERLQRLFREANLTPLKVQYAGKDYLRTLTLWRNAFVSAWPRIAEQGFDIRFKRLWTYYLQYCEAGFHHRTIDLGRFVLAKPI